MAAPDSNALLCNAGGPAMIRAAAKNHADVAVVVDAADYGRLLKHLASGPGGDAFAAFRRKLAWKAFQHCATYDSTVAEWLWTQIGEQVYGCRAVALCSMQPLLHILPVFWLHQRVPGSRWLDSKPLCSAGVPWLTGFSSK